MRKLLKALSLIIICAAVMLLSSCGGERPVEKQLFAMDTVMTLKAYGRNAEEALEKAKVRITELENILSAQITSSDIARLNASGGLPVKVSDDTASVIRAAVDISALTNGASDITVYPVVKAWGFISKEYRVPDRKELDSLLKKTGFEKIIADGSSITLPEGVEIDTGSIAKGYTSQCVVELLRENGVSSAVISLGGNVQTLGAKSGSESWSIALSDPLSPQESVGTLNIGEAAVVTSGGYQRFFEKDGKKYHHIIDPSTGCPAESGLLSATVVCENGTYADGLSTALFVMGVEKSLKLYEKNKGFEAILITEDRRIIVTDGLKDKFTPSQGNGYIYEQ